MATLPIKTRIIEYCILNDAPVTASELVEVLSQEEYKGEKTCRKDYIEKQMLCYCRVGFMEPVGLKEIGGQEELQFQVTEAGKEELVYVPGHGNKLF